MLAVVATLAGLGMAQADDPFADFDESEVEDVQVTESKDGPERWNGEAYPVVDRAVVLPFAETARKGAFRFFIDHRTNRSFTDEPFHNLLGFDAGALKIGIGLRYGILDDLEAGIYRLSGGPDAFDTYELDLKYQFLHAEHHGVDGAVRGGVSWFSQIGNEDAFGGFGQALVPK